jgi:hypothetical protein
MKNFMERKLKQSTKNTVVDTKLMLQKRFSLKERLQKEEGF